MCIAERERERVRSKMAARSGGACGSAGRCRKDRGHRKKGSVRRGDARGSHEMKRQRGKPTEKERERREERGRECPSRERQENL